MARVARGFRCSDCGWESPAFTGRCSRCQSWNTLVEYVSHARPTGRATEGGRGASRPSVVALADAAEDSSTRLLTGIPELDRVLGGGVVPGSVVLMGGEPGVGKSTLALQAAAGLAAAGHVVAYVCGEESPRQVRLRAARLGLATMPLSLIPEPELHAAFLAAEGCGAQVVIVDSIQSVTVAGVESRAGGPAQLAESGAAIVAWAKATGVATIVTGHVTKTGEIAGPRLLEHLVDVVLYFEGGDGGTVRLLRATKNRFGATDEVGVFEMGGTGLRSVENPGTVFLDHAGLGASGCAVTAVIEGSRPLAVEVQALAVPSYLAAPRRTASGLEVSRLHLLLAVLSRRVGLQAGNLDVVVAVAGGLRLRDPGADLAVFCALGSAVKDVPVRPGTGFVGEVALSGAVRPVQSGARRLQELGRLGFSRVVVPAGQPPVEGVDLVPVRTVREAVRAALDGD